MPNPKPNRPDPSEGGRARAEALTPQRRAAIAQQASRAAHSPAAVARRLANSWPDLTDEQRAEVRLILSKAGIR